MSESLKVTNLLRAAAEAFEPPEAPDRARVTARAARRRRGAQRAACAGAAALALVATVLVSLRADTAQREDTTTAGLAGTQPGGATAEDLRSFRWSNLPVAPVEPRNQAAVGWTGREMIVWGGAAPDGRLLADGAAFDPARSRWRPIATPSGVEPRFGASTLWTGTELLVVGGQTAPGANSRNGVAPANAGAYNPGSDQWRSLPAGPADGEEVVAAVLAGAEAVVFTSERSAAVYDPAADRWRAMPSLPMAAERDLVDVVAVWTGRDLLVWGLWTHRDISPVTGSGTVSWGIELFDLDLATGAWAPRPGHGEKLLGVSRAHWTGHDVVIPAAGVFRGYSSGPAPHDLHGLRYDPGTDAYTAMAPGPLDDAHSSSYWTGAALLAVSHSIRTGPEPIDDRDTAAWDPATGQWARLERAPPAVTYQTPLVWTGEEFLAYGPQPVRFSR